MFLHFYPKMMALHFFKGLRTLCLINQDICELEGLEECLQLEKLWLSENQLAEIKGLTRLVNLRELYLHSNRIRRIQGLDTLSQLEVLWLTDNCIATLEGLSRLPALRELQLARNHLCSLGEALAANTRLEVLNLADNAIGTFKELRSLTSLPLLTDLCLSDPMWGDCPLSGLCNYQTYVLFLLPRLTLLDTLLLAEETKALAEATFLKKQMYYNMRIKTLHRHARNLVRQAAEGAKARLSAQASRVAPLVLARKEAQRELEESESYGGPFALQPSRHETLTSKLHLINERMSHLASVDACGELALGSASARCYRLVEAHVARMMLELQTAGNVRLEEGGPGDAWLSSCADLVTSRFGGGEYEALGVTGVTVTGVARVHNRWLRTRFEQRLAVVTAADARERQDAIARERERERGEAKEAARAERERLKDAPGEGGGCGGGGGKEKDRERERDRESRAEAPEAGTGVGGGVGGKCAGGSGVSGGGAAPSAPPPIPRRAMEYLFFGEHPSMPGELDRVAEEGFRSSHQMTAMGLDGATVMSNSVYLADGLRLEAGLESAAGGGSGSSSSSSTHPPPSLLTGRLMIVKAYLGKTAQDMMASLGAHSGCLNGNGPGGPRSNSGPGGGGRKLYRDGKLVPAATLEGPKVTQSSFQGADSVFRLKPTDPKSRLWYVFDHTLILPEYVVEFTYETTAASRLASGCSDSSSSGSSSGGAWLDSLQEEGPMLAAAVLEGLVRDVSDPACAQPHSPSHPTPRRPLARPLLPWLALAPRSPTTSTAPPPAPPPVCPSPPSASTTTPRAPSRADASAAAIAALARSPPPPPPRPKLRQLCPESLQRHVAGLVLSGLTYLNLHNCALRSLEGLPALTELQVLVLSYNELCRIERLSDFSSLTRLDLSHNRLSQVEGLGGLGRLQRLDLSSNQICRLEEVHSLRRQVSTLTHLDLGSNPVSCDKAYRSTALRKLLPTLVQLDSREVDERERAMFGGDNAGALTRQLIQEHGACGTRRAAEDPGMSREARLGCITELVIERQHIRRLQHLGSLASLRRASFADNELGSMEGLEGCVALEELCLQDNRIGAVAGIATLTRLTKLQLGQNRLVSLAGLGGAVALRQLSVEDNELTSLAGVEALGLLMELYAGNNRIVEQRETQRLRELPKLIILDLSGNPMCGLVAGAAAAAAAAAAAGTKGAGSGAGNVSSASAVGSASAAQVQLQQLQQQQQQQQQQPPGTGGLLLDDYRLYVVYNVRRLKVLDGVSVSAVEQASAKGKYSGRLTSEFLQDRLGHAAFDRILDLDLAGLKVRDVGTVFLSPDWSDTLTELNMEANTLTDVTGLVLLSQLQQLRLSGNRLGCEDATFSMRRLYEKSVELQRAFADPRRARDGGAAAVAPVGSSTPVGFELWPHLQVLHLGSNQISAMLPLQLSCLAASLRTLFLHGNDITRVEGLEGLVNLQELVLDRNRVRYLDPESFLGLPRLRELRLEENGLRSLANLHPLASSLQALHLGGNRITEPADLDKLGCLTALLELSLAGNPLTRKQTYRALLISKLPRLYSADGQVISHEEREYSEHLFTAQAPQADVALMLAAQAVVVGGKMALKMTNLDFAGMASGQFPGAHFGGGGFPGPFLQSSPMVLNGPAGLGLGLEGVGFSGAAMETALTGVGGTRAAIGASQQQQQQQQQQSSCFGSGSGASSGGAAAPPSDRRGATGLVGPSPVVYGGLGGRATGLGVPGVLGAHQGHIGGLGGGPASVSAGSGSGSGSGPGGGASAAGLAGGPVALGFAGGAAAYPAAAGRGPAAGWGGEHGGVGGLMALGMAASGGGKAAAAAGGGSHSPGKVGGVGGSPARRQPGALGGRAAGFRGHL
ncbi:MAG: hypothetical protein WDW36_007372 [Sanguina aurantia]